MSWTMMEILCRVQLCCFKLLGSEDIIGGGDCNDDVGDNTVSPAVPSGLNVYPGAEELCDHRLTIAPIHSTLRTLRHLVFTTVWQ